MALPPKAQQGCWNCVYLREDKCQFGPPRVILKDNVIRSVWPVVKQNDWCGQWRHAAEGREAV